MKKGNQRISDKRGFARAAFAILTAICFCGGGLAQNSLPAPGSGSGPGGGGFGGGGFGGNSLPAPGSGGGYYPSDGPGGPGMPPPSNWGGPWNNGSSVNFNISVGSPGWQNQGTVTVMACGYDSYGVWRTIPLRVGYTWNGMQYNVTVLNAYNPWTDMWVRGIDANAYNTSYYLRGNTYNFYTVLPTGTYYFNL
ncbi:MAG: hypothetical protein K2O24_09425 [Muribaculaceae bacterium]|nr:hypothetical protein [Muribaculaceae bacterium]